MTISITTNIHVIRGDLGRSKLVGWVLKRLFLHIDSAGSILGLLFLDYGSFLVYFNGGDLVIPFGSAALMLFYFHLVGVFFADNFGPFVDHFNLLVQLLSHEIFRIQLLIVPLRIHGLYSGIGSLFGHLLVESGGRTGVIGSIGL